MFDPFWNLSILPSPASVALAVSYALPLLINVGCANAPSPILNCTGASIVFDGSVIVMFGGEL